MWLISCAVADILVSSVLCVGLYRRIAGFRTETDSLLRKLIYLAVRSASYTGKFYLFRSGSLACKSSTLISISKSIKHSAPQFQRSWLWLSRSIRHTQEYQPPFPVRVYSTICPYHIPTDLFAFKRRAQFTLRSQFAPQPYLRKQAPRRTRSKNDPRLLAFSPAALRCYFLLRYQYEGWNFSTG